MKGQTRISQLNYQSTKMSLIITINLKRDEILLKGDQHVFGDQPVCHEWHVLGGLPEGLDDSGVADDHDDAGDQECDHQLVESEVDPEMEDDAN
jgi:hypothetical protein